MDVRDWIFRRVGRRTSDRATYELKLFLAGIKQFDTNELALVAAQSADVCRGLHAAGIDLLHPGVAVIQQPNLLLRLTKAIIELQERGDPSRVPGFAVWVYTLRSEQNIKLRYLAKDMWAYIERGFPDAKLAALEFETLTGHELVVEDQFLQIPTGFKAK